MFAALLKAVPGGENARVLVGTALIFGIAYLPMRSSKLLAQEQEPQSILLHPSS